jgi:membrane associated rhomboid family serine protease
MQQESRKINFADQKTPPLMTYMLIILIVVLYCMGAAARTDSWFAQNAFQAQKIYSSVRSMNWADVATMISYSNFMTNNVWAMIGSMYFLWAFGTSVESRVGANRYIYVLICGLTLPWVVLTFDALMNNPWRFVPFEGPDKPYLYYFGPNLLIFTIMGAYAVLTPPKKVDLSGGMPRPKGEIFKKQKQTPVQDKFGLNPWTFVAAFCVCTAGQHAAMLGFYKTFDNCTLFSALAAAGVGYLIANTLLQSAVETFKDGPLKLEALKRYHELVDLDVSQEDAIKGTARAMGLPKEQVRSWVTKNKGRLRIS